MSENNKKSFQNAVTENWTVDQWTQYWTEKLPESWQILLRKQKEINDYRKKNPEEYKKLFRETFKAPEITGAYVLATVALGAGMFLVSIGSPDGMSVLVLPTTLFIGIPLSQNKRVLDQLEQKMTSEDTGKA